MQILPLALVGTALWITQLLLVISDIVRWEKISRQGPLNIQISFNLQYTLLKLVFSPSLFQGLINDCRILRFVGPGGDLRVYLEGLALADDVQEYVKQNPFGQRPITERNLSWRFYLRVIEANSSPPPDTGDDG